MGPTGSSWIRKQELLKTDVYENVFFHDFLDRLLLALGIGSRRSNEEPKLGRALSVFRGKEQGEVRVRFRDGNPGNAKGQGHLIDSVL